MREQNILRATGNFAVRIGPLARRGVFLRTLYSAKHDVGCPGCREAIRHL